MKNLLRGYDYTLLITPIVLAIFGTIMIYSASMVATVAEGLESTYYLKRQLIWLLLGFVSFGLAAVFPYRAYRKLVKPMLLVGLVLLVAVLVFGDEAYNAVRSISFAGFRIQPSEFIKIVLIIYIASVYTKKQSYISNFAKGVFPPLVMVGFYIGLIILQPDLGTSVIILAIVAIVVSSAGVRGKHIFMLGSIGAAFIAIAIPILKSETRMSRFTGAYQPFLDPDDTGHHLIQSYLAIGGGGVSGEGLGLSIQKLGYLWGAHTDFIMAVIAEELGMLGVIIVIGLLGLIVLRGLYIAYKCEDQFGTLIAIGISSMVGIQAFVNLGAISGLLPITGVTLPFISYGGSSLLVLMISMGILNNIARKVKLQERTTTTMTQKPTNQFRNRSGQVNG